MYSSGPGAAPTPPTYTTPPAPDYGAQQGYYAGQQQPAYPSEQPGYPTSGGAAPGYPTSGGAAYGYQQQPYQQPQYAQAGAYPQPAGFPAGYQQQPMYDAQGRPLSDKSKLVAGLLGIFIGWLGVGRFYTGHIGLGVAQLVVSLVSCGLGGLWGLIDGILILVNGGTDAQGRTLRD